jgi:SnoaL-like domain
MLSEPQLLEMLYARFNARDMAAVIALMDANVLWANGMEGGHVNGHEEVRRYWTRQWALIDPHVEPMSFATGPDGEIVVEVRQTVRDLEGRLLSDKVVGHVFKIEGGLIKRFDIRVI